MSSINSDCNSLRYIVGLWIRDSSKYSCSNLFSMVEDHGAEACAVLFQYLYIAV